MGIFDIFKKKKVIKEIITDVEPPHEHSNVRTNYIEINDPSLDDVICFVTDMLEDSNDFVVFTPKETINNIRFIQACQIPKGIDLEIGFVKGKKQHLLRRIVDGKKENIYMIFNDYYNGKLKVNLNEFSPVERM